MSTFISFSSISKFAIFQFLLEITLHRGRYFSDSDRSTVSFVIVIRGIQRLLGARGELCACMRNAENAAALSEGGWTAGYHHRPEQARRSNRNMSKSMTERTKPLRERPRSLWKDDYFASLFNAFRSLGKEAWTVVIRDVPGCGYDSLQKHIIPKLLFDDAVGLREPRTQHHNIENRWGIGNDQSRTAAN